MCDPVTAIIAGTAALAGTTVYGQAKQAKAQKKALRQAEKEAAQTKAANERAINAANQKQPNTAAIFNANRSAAGSGVGSTLLTGRRGVTSDQSTLLGRSTLLGG